MARISLCLIARDEERFIGGCLASVRGVADEIVVVDSGSRDATPELCRRAGAKVVPFTWCDDFAAARNEALRHATGDFILQLDADERLAAGAGRAIRAAVEGARAEAFLLRLHNASALDAPEADVLSGRARIGDPLWLLRLVRRTPDLAWQGVIHENLFDWLARHGQGAVRLDADLVHLGAVPSLRAATGKEARNLELLRRQCRRSPEDLMFLGYLAMACVTGGAIAEAREVAERAWSIVLARPAASHVLRVAVARATLLLAADPAGAVETLRVAESRIGHNPDIEYLRATALEQLAARAADAAERAAHLAAAEASARAAMTSAGQAQGDNVICDSSGVLAWKRLGSVLLAAGRAAEAEPLLRRAIERDPGDEEAQLGLAEAALRRGEALPVLDAVARRLGAKPDPWAIAAEAALRLGARADAMLFARRAVEQMQAAHLYAPHRRLRVIEVLRALGVNVVTG